MKHTYALAGILLAFVTLRAEAANPKPTTPAPSTAAAKPSSAADTKTVKVLRFDSLSISGEASKPQVFYLLNRKKIQMRHRPEEKDFINTLEETVKGEPF